MARKSDQPLKGLGRKKLTNMELQFMKFIWQNPEGVSSEVIYEHFPQARGTKSTILYHISEKGYVYAVQKGLHHFYQAVVTKEDYEQALLQQEMEQTLGFSSFDSLVAAFCGRKGLTEGEKKRLNELIEELKNEAE